MSEKTISNLAVPAPSTSIFQNRFVQRIMLSAVLLQTGIWVRNFAILLFVMDKTNNDPFAVSLISVVEFAPIFIFSFIGGTFADRWRPKNTMVWCDLLSALSVFVVLLTIIFGKWQAVFFVTLLSAIFSQFSQPSAMKLFKRHLSVDQLQTGMAMFQTIMAIFMIIGPVLGTFVYQTFGIHFAIGVMGLMFLLSAGVLFFLPPDQRSENEEQTTNVWQEMLAGFRYVWSNKVLKTVGGTFVISGLAVGVIQPLSIFIVLERLGLPKENVQWLLMANGAAMLIGGGMVMKLAGKMSPQKLLAIGFFASALSVGGIGLSTEFILTVAFEFLNGLFFPCIYTGINTLILQTSEEAFIGRVNGVLSPLFMGAMVIMMSMAGWLKSQLSLLIIFETAALLFLVGMLLLVPIFNASTARK